jgi:hypothetical protein
LQIQQLRCAKEWNFQLEVLAREAKCLINVAAVLAGMLQLSNNCFLVPD